MSLAAMCCLRVFWGARISIIVGIVATLVFARHRRDLWRHIWLRRRMGDDLMMRFVDILYSLPFIFIASF